MIKNCKLMAENQNLVAMDSKNQEIDDENISDSRKLDQIILKDDIPDSPSKINTAILNTPKSSKIVTSNKFETLGEWIEGKAEFKHGINGFYKSMTPRSKNTPIAPSIAEKVHNTEVKRRSSATAYLRKSIGARGSCSPSRNSSFYSHKGPDGLDNDSGLLGTAANTQDRLQKSLFRLSKNDNNNQGSDQTPSSNSNSSNEVFD
mmetsp:Transcript_28149/g.24924  ORF Transcript_28149/g.24924 Transcript_28149/m.24924 type:complete len:204 (-) Transcript_28149:126-737(-)